MQNVVTVYTRTTCPYCVLLKKFLDAKGATYKTLNIEESDDAMKAILAMTGRSITPTTIIEKSDGTKDVIVGFNLSRISPALL